MTYQEKTLKDYLITLRYRKKWLVSATLVILLISAGLAFGLPPVYRSAATILIEQQEIPQDLVRSTVTSFADQRIQMINQRVMTRANLLEIINKFDLYQKERKHEPDEVLVKEMRDNINMDIVSAEVVDPRSGRPTQATIAFTLSFDNENPAVSQKVTNEMVSLYLNENLKNRTKMAVETSDFLSDEAEKLRVRISDLERDLATFKEQNMGTLPELVQLNLQLMDRNERELSEVDSQIRLLEERNIYLESELAQMNPHGQLYSESGERILGTSDRLKVLQTQYVSMKAVYGPDHPNIRRMAKEIEAFKTELADEGALTEADQEKNLSLSNEIAALEAELASASNKYSPDHPDIIRLTRTIAHLNEELKNDSQPALAQKTISNSQPDNPAYIQLQAQLEASNGEMRSLISKKRELNEKLAVLEDRLTKAPQVEREYRALSRDYDNAFTKYKEAQAKQMEAQLAEALESERKGERFTLIEPPALPEEPIKPNRLAILLVGLVLSLGGGVGSSIARDSMDPAVQSLKDVTAVFNMAPLMSIPYIETEMDIRKKSRHRKVLAASFVGCFVIAGLLIHFMFMPMDVLFYTALRRFGL